MQERWHLVQSGVDHKSIRLRGDSLYAKDKLHGRVSNSKCVCVSAGPGGPCGSNNPISPRSTSPTAEHQQKPVTLAVNIATPVSLDTTPVNNPCSQQNTSIDISTPPAHHLLLLVLLLYIIQVLLIPDNLILSLCVLMLVA